MHCTPDLERMKGSLSQNKTLSAWLILREWVPTDKWASRVGASLLEAAGIPDPIAPNMDANKELLCRAATDAKWIEGIQRRLQNGIADCPLFDTARWVRNLEVGLTEAVSRAGRGELPVDIVLVGSNGN